MIASRPSFRSALVALPVIGTFLLLSSFTAGSVVNLAVMDARGRQADSAFASAQRFFLRVDVDGRYYLNDVRLTADELVQKLRKFVAGKHDDVLFVRADKGAEYGLFQAAMDLVAKSGVARAQVQKDSLSR